MNIDELLKVLKNDIIFPEEGYVIEGDVVECSDLIKSKPNDAGYMYGRLEFVSNDSAYYLSFYFPNSKYQKSDILNRHVLITGKIHTFGDKIQIVVDTLEDKGISYRTKQYENLKTKYKHRIRNKGNKFNPPPKELSSVALITIDNTHGQADFNANIKEWYKPRVHTYFAQNMTGKYVADEIRKASSDNNDIICLIRAGVDGLSMLNDERIIDAIIEAQDKGQYIFTGLGHAKVDYLVCDDIADWAANVPADAVAEINKYFNNCYYSKKDEKNNQNLENYIHSLKTQRNMLFIIVFMLICYIAYKYFI